jgi:hypothetical protein
MATNEGGGDLVWLGRLGIGSLLGYVVVVGFLFLRPPAPPSGNFCERQEGSREHVYDHNCINVAIGQRDMDSSTIGQVDWYTSPPHAPELSRLSMRRHGKAERGFRYDLFLPDKLEPVGSMDHDGGWIILRFASNPSREHWMKTDQPTFSSWAE